MPLDIKQLFCLQLNNAYYSPMNHSGYDKHGRYLQVGASSGAGTAYPSGAHKFTPGFYWGSCYSIFSFLCMFCRSLCLSFCTFSFGLVLSVLLLLALCCLFFFDIRILITTLLFSNYFSTNTILERDNPMTI